MTYAPLVTTALSAALPEVLDFVAPGVQTTRTCFVLTNLSLQTNLGLGDTYGLLSKGARAVALLAAVHFGRDHFTSLVNQSGIALLKELASSQYLRISMEGVLAVAVLNLGCIIIRRVSFSSSSKTPNPSQSPSQSPPPEPEHVSPPLSPKSEKQPPVSPPEPEEIPPPQSPPRSPEPSPPPSPTSENLPPVSPPEPKETPPPSPLKPPALPEGFDLDAAGFIYSGIFVEDGKSTRNSNSKEKARSKLISRVMKERSCDWCAAEAYLKGWTKERKIQLYMRDYNVGYEVAKEEAFLKRKRRKR